MYVFPTFQIAKYGRTKKVLLEVVQNRYVKYHRLQKYHVSFGKTIRVRGFLKIKIGSGFGSQKNRGSVISVRFGSFRISRLGSSAKMRNGLTEIHIMYSIALNCLVYFANIQNQ